MDNLVTVKDLVDVALEGKHRQKELLCNAASNQAANLLYRGLKKIVKQFNKSRNMALGLYLRSLETGENPETALGLYRLYTKCWHYYKQELYTVIYMLNEFDEYCAHGHLIRMFLLGLERPEKDQHDYIAHKVKSAELF